MPDRDSHLSRRTFLKAGSALLLVTTAAGFPEAASADDGGPLRLQNDLVQAEFDGRGLTALHDKALNRTIPFSGDGFAVTLDRATLDSAQFPAPTRSQDKNTVSYGYVLGPHVVLVTYVLQAGWRFVSKQVSLDATDGADYRVKRLTPFRATLGTPVVEELLSRDVAVDEAWDRSFGTFLRFGGQPDYGLFFAVQNPFMQWQRDGQQVSVSYAPEMDWKPNYGPFPGDRVCVGPYGLSGHIFPGLDSDAPGRDIAEWQALTDCVRAFLPPQPKKSTRLHVGASENDSQIDVATPQGRSEYKRIIDQTAAVGCLNLLYAPSNSALSSGVKSGDLGVWENGLWMGLGQKIRQEKWDPESDPVPPSVKAMQDYAAKHDVKLDAYVYPSLPWRPAWSTGEWANCANREFQDWLIGKLVDFQRKTEVGGYWFENWQLDEGWRLNYAEASPYAQWYGCRWILESLRDRLPDLMIGGGANVKPSPWTWLAVTFPFLLSVDFKPPGWIGTPPDLHIDRLHGNSQRWTAWRYCTVFWPSEILPGSLIHGLTTRDTEDAPGWDYLGWKYSVLSSIATAPMNHVINYLPARDEAEYAHFAPEDKKWLRDWLDWTDTHRETLRHVRPITGPPRTGLVDGTAAITADRGFVFFFNPDYRAGDAEFRLDTSIGLTQGQTFILTALHPRPGPVAYGHYGDTITLPMEATSALVLEITPSRPKPPLLLYPTGSATLNGQTLVLTNVSGLIGEDVELPVVVPAGRPVMGVTVNGHPFGFTRTGDTVTAHAHFAGTPFGQCHPVGTYDPAFTGGGWQGAFTIPARIFTQLHRRKAAWPIPYTPDDLKATWLGPDRLLIYVQIADPKDNMAVTADLDGQPIELQKAYTSFHRFPGSLNAFVGWYLDVSALAPDVPHTLALTLPTLEAGQFQGVFFENVETEYTQEVTTA